jgi:glycosyltransferase involved in cell wall biosynthesis
VRSVAVVIPAYNEQATIRAVVERARRQVGCVIVVDDGSSDGTAQALEGLEVTVLRNARNAGKARSLVRGAEEALRRGADAIVTLDGDGQHPPEEIARLLAAHRREPRAIVIGTRLHEARNIPRARYLANRCANFWVGWAARRRVEDSQSGFRVYPAQAWRALLPRCNHVAGFVLESEILIEAGRLGVPVLGVPIPAIYPTRARRSHFRPAADIARIGSMLAWKLLPRGLFLTGLLRSLRSDRADRETAVQRTDARS